MTGTRPSSTQRDRSSLPRFLLPAALGLGVFLVLFVTYYSSWYIQNRALHWMLTDLVGTAYGFMLMCGVLFIFPALYFRGARPTERVIGSLFIIGFWCVKEVIRMSAFFPVGQSLFFLLFPVHFNIILLNIGLVGLCEIICGAIAKKKCPEKKRAITPLPTAAFLIMIGVLVFTNFDGGVTYFFLYNDLYILLFM